MENILIKPTDDTPEIYFSKKEGIFRITGKSLPEDVIEFYTPVFHWLEQYTVDPNEETLLHIRVSYFNSASQRALNEIFTILSRIHVKGKKVKVEWFYNEDDDEMREAGKEYAEISNIPFNYKSYIME